jgi:AbrB family looped-hinge helix DNA binding protein
MKVRLSQNGGVVIPAAIRRKYGLKAGAYLQIVDHGGVLAIVPGFKDAVGDGAGMLKGGGSLAEHGSRDASQQDSRDFL